MTCIPMLLAPGSEHLQQVQVVGREVHHVGKASHLLTYLHTYIGKCPVKSVKDPGPSQVPGAHGVFRSSGAAGTVVLILEGRSPVVPPLWRRRTGFHGGVSPAQLPLSCTRPVLSLPPTFPFQAPTHPVSSTPSKAPYVRPRAPVLRASSS